jgi:hypothetical protein
MIEDSDDVGLANASRAHKEVMLPACAGLPGSKSAEYFVNQCGTPYGYSFQNTGVGKLRPEVMNRFS